MAKGKGKGGSGGPHKAHGPKKHLFKEFKPMIHVFAQAGLLTKYSNFESWQMACTARGLKNPDRGLWQEFCKLPTVAAKDEWLKNLRK